MSLFKTDRVLVPIDFSEDATQALSTTLSSVPAESDVYAVHVLPRLEATDPSVVWETLSDETRQQNMQKAFKERFSGPEYGRVTFDVVFGDPSSEIIDYAKDKDITLIVIPSHGRTGLSRFFMGSVAERVVRFAQCPVLVVRQFS